MPLRTGGKEPGLYFLTVVARTEEGRPDERHLALRIKSPADRLRVTVSEPWTVREGSSAGRFTRLPDGALVSGAAAFLALWRATPGFRLPARLLSARPVVALLYVAYMGFLRLRRLWR